MTTYTLKLIGINESGSIGRQLKATVTVPGGSVSFGFEGTSSKHHIIAKNVPIDGNVITSLKISGKSPKAKIKRKTLGETNSITVPIIVNAMEWDKKTSDLPYSGSTNLIIDMNSPVNSPPAGTVTIPIAELGGRGKSKGKTATLTFHFEAEIKSVFDIRDIPGIMTANGWTNGAALMNRWFNAPAAVAPGSVQLADTKTITMNWVLGFPRAKTVYDDLINNKLTDKAAIAVIKKKYGKTVGNFGDFTLPVPILQKDNIQHEQVDIPSKVDDMFCALGHFSIYVMVKGVATNDAINITDIGLCVMDSYDFNGFQPLGFWNNLTNYGGFDPLDGTYVSNASFRAYRKKSGMGGDYLVYSDLIVIKLAKPLIIPK
jgi:hypothetical protein